MWANPATRDNMARLGQNGIHVLGPAAGSQACGDEGLGRMEAPEAIVAAVAGLFDTGTLAGLRVLVTAGPTREAVDPVRYLSNHSSGKMGFAVAAAAREAGAQVTLVSGPVALVTPPGVERLDVKSAQQMHDAVMERAARQDIVIGAAAVADYRLAAPGAHKMKKDCGGLQLALEPTPDILTAVTALQPRPFTVGFAAETQDLAERARDKRARKSLDMIAANWVGRPGSGFDSDDNALTVYWAEGQHELAHATKDKLARQLIKVIAERYHGKRTTQNT
jgi:phosphopantothenoylcysteine decarboxylase/phosphopantothenate--cysteine ligase